MVGTRLHIHRLISQLCDRPHHHHHHHNIGNYLIHSCCNHRVCTNYTAFARPSHWNIRRGNGGRRGEEETFCAISEKLFGLALIALSTEFPSASKVLFSRLFAAASAISPSLLLQSSSMSWPPLPPSLPSLIAAVVLAAIFTPREMNGSFFMSVK